MEWVRGIVEWIQGNWNILQPVLIIAIGLFALWRVKFAGDLLKMGGYALLALLELCNEGVASVTRETTDIVAGEIYKYLNAAGVAGWVSLEQTQKITWKLWCLFRDAVLKPVEADGANPYKAFLAGYRSARLKLAERGLIGQTKVATRPFGRIR